MNIHTPERQPNETQAQYRERQSKSKQINNRLTLKGWLAINEAIALKKQQRNTQLRHAQS